MKTNELRIGNWVKFNGCLVQIRELQYMSKLDVYLDSNVNVATYKPIPLTEEILLKCGFDKYMIDNLYQLGCWQVYFEDTPIFRIIGCSLCEVKYLHQLQNIYYALTNQELEVKL